MEPKIETFDTEAEAVAFCKGLDAAIELLAIELLDSDHLSYDRFIQDDKWVVEYSVTC